MELPNTTIFSRLNKKIQPIVTYPETVVIVIAVHGFIPADSIESLPKFQINSKINTLIKVNVAPPGSAAAISGTSMKNLQLLESKKEENDINMFEEIIERNTAGISEKSQEELLAIMLSTKDELKSSFELPVAAEYQDENQTLDKGFNVFKYFKNENSGEMINKSYGIEDNEVEKESGINWKIMCLNSNPPTDLTKDIKISLGEPVLHHEPREDDFIDKYVLTTEMIIDYLSRHNVKNILIFDFSCSNFCNMSLRETRLARKEILKNNNAYGKKIGRKTGRKTRRRTGRRTGRKTKKRS